MDEEVESFARQLHKIYYKTEGQLDGISDIDWNGHTPHWKEKWMKVARFVLTRQHEALDERNP